MSTIAAISTPVSSGGISVIRISGEDAFLIAKKIFTPITSENVESMAGYTCAYGKVVFNNDEIDDAVLTVFRAPKSYTGENVVEISCHGGIYVTNRILRAIISSGAVPAAPGEFTKRAFLNGKMTLTQAEAVMDIISAQGETAHKCSVAMHEGALFRRIKSVSDRMVKILGELAAWVDYPDEDIADVDENSLLVDLSNILSELKKISSTYDSGRILREGIETAIVGRPNVGKSTLMNLLSGYERSIVTEVAGTTRDVIEESVRLGDVVLRLCDTAGIRNTSDTVEEMGVNLAYKRLDRAELVLAVFDYSQELKHEDFLLTEKLSGKNVIAVINKSDKDQLLDIDFINEHYPENVLISAKEGNGIETLREKILKVFRASDIDSSAGIIANERQKRCIDMSISSLKDAVLALSQSETLDAVTVLVDEAESFLLELTGEKITEAVVDEVFSHFCVGK
ncbi:MAG TPA: tRNA uridine-5-carboxymethylaminomethyl(34) synthesis GTPase MnmE [Oscillospiraceae bacterium]|nr:tRNA uridine-5-carboxymethylaminomethyl(34) synthesis GTPase MnmE [Oscillospiraceae bacterium]